MRALQPCTSEGFLKGFNYPQKPCKKCRSPAEPHLGPAGPGPFGCGIRGSSNRSGGLRGQQNTSAGTAPNYGDSPELAGQTWSPQEQPRCCDNTQTLPRQERGCRQCQGWMLVSCHLPPPGTRGVGDTVTVGRKDDTSPCRAVSHAETRWQWWGHGWDTGSLGFPSSTGSCAGRCRVSPPGRCINHDG